MMLLSLSGLASATLSMVLNTDDWTEKCVKIQKCYSTCSQLQSNMITCVCVYLADGEGVPIQLLCEHESLCEHSFVVVGVLDEGRGGRMAKHRAHVAFECLHHSRQQLLVPAAAYYKPKTHQLGLVHCLSVVHEHYHEPEGEAELTHPYISSFFTTCLPYCDLHKLMMSSGGNNRGDVMTILYCPMSKRDKRFAVDHQKKSVSSITCTTYPVL